MHVVEGFDLSAFNRLAAPSYRIRAGDERVALRSKPDDLSASISVGWTVSGS